MSYRTEQHSNGDTTIHVFSTQELFSCIVQYFENHGIECVKLPTNPISPFLISKLILCVSLLSLAKAPHLPHCD